MPVTRSTKLTVYGSKIKVSDLLELIKHADIDDEVHWDSYKVTRYYPGEQDTLYLTLGDD